MWGFLSLFITRAWSIAVAGLFTMPDLDLFDTSIFPFTGICELWPILPSAPLESQDGYFG